jgi:CRP-like cAMP-binding protein
MISSDTQGAPAIWRLGSGAIVMSAHQPDGPSRILDFVLPGAFFCCPVADDAFELEAAVDGTCVTMYQAAAAEALAAIRPHCGAALDGITVAPADRFWRQISILGPEILEERLNAFLTDIYDRLSGGSDVPVAVPMRAEHVAEYLSVSQPELTNALQTLASRNIIRCNRRGTITIFKRPDSFRFRRTPNQITGNGQDYQKSKRK